MTDPVDPPDPDLDTLTRGDQKNPLGAVGHTLARNLKDIREAQRLTYTALAKLLADAGRPIAVLGLRRIERGERRVDVDDLFALSWVLGVPPSMLLLPVESGAEVQITPTTRLAATRAFRWFAGHRERAMANKIPNRSKPETTMATYTRRAVRTERVEYALPSPSGWGELWELLTQIQDEFGCAGADDAVTVEARGDEIVCWYETEPEE